MKLSFKQCLKICLICGVSVISADEVKNIVKNGDFEEGGKYWSVPRNVTAKFQRGLGQTQSGGLQLTVTPKQRGLVIQTLTGFERLQKYKVTAWIRTDGNARSSITMDVYRKKGGYVRGAGFSNGMSVTGTEWSFYRQTYYQKGEDPAQHIYHLVLLTYFKWRTGADKVKDKAEGNAWYDNIMIVKDVPLWTLTQVYPSHESVTARGGEVVLSSFFEHGFLPAGIVPEVSAVIKQVGKKTEQKLAAKFTPRSIILNLPPAEPGAASIKVTLKDPANGKIFGEKVLPIRIRKEEKLPANACMLDRYGRAIVNGKPYMPLGVYCNLPKKGVTPEFLKLLDKIRDTQVFNCFMAYSAPWYLRSDKDVIRFFDEAHKRNLKVQAGLGYLLTAGVFGNFRTATKDPAVLEKRVEKIISIIKNHPALLAYFIDDETTVDKIAKVIRGRKLINKYDPFHPAWGVSFQTEAYEHYLPAVDIISYDTYPVRINGNLFHGWSQARKANILTPMIWMVPQCYQRDNGVPITVEGMLYSCALPIMYGARGFIFWTVGPTRYEKGDMDKRWGELAEVGRTLKGMENFILSEIPARLLDVKNRKEKTEAALLTDGKGNFMIAAAGMYQDHDSEIRIPENLTLVSSKFGHLKEISPGVLRYEGGRFTCDYGKLVSRKGKR